MRVLTKDDLIDMLCCDVQIDRIEWANEGRDLRLGLIVPGDGTKTDVAPRRVILARWVRGLKLHLSFRDDEGRCPMTWDVEANELESEKWFVRFDFAHVGEMTFECNELLCDCGDEEAGRDS